MTWLARFFGGTEAAGLVLTERQRLLVADWRQLPEPDMRRSHYRCRYVVVDVETNGVNVKTDRLCSIAALGLADGQIDFKDAFQVVISDPETPADPARILAERPDTDDMVGVQAVDALISFLHFAGKAPLVAYNVPFVAGMIERAIGGSLGLEPGLPWIDLAWVMPDVFRDMGDMQGRLDAWLAHFGVESICRHNAVSDAYATAQLLQLTIARSARKGFDTPASLLALEKARRHIHQSG
jgi:DNA polymerase-3 subunit epsilon